MRLPWVSRRIGKAMAKKLSRLEKRIDDIDKLVANGLSGALDKDALREAISRVYESVDEDIRLLADRIDQLAAASRSPENETTLSKAIEDALKMRSFDLETASRNRNWAVVQNRQGIPEAEIVAGILDGDPIPL